MTKLDGHWRSKLSGVVVSVVGGILVWIALDHLFIEHRDLFTVLLGGGFPLVMGVATVAGGTWIARTRLSNDELARLLGWWVFGMVVTALMGVTAIVYEQSHGVVLIDGQYIVTNNLTAGSSGGLLVGYLYTRSHRRAEQLAAERKSLASERERLEVLNRVVRHDIRNDMNVILGWLQELEAHVDTEGQAALKRVTAASEHVVELTSTARQYVEVIVGETDPELTDVPLGGVLHDEVQTRREAYPEASFELDGDLPQVTVKANEMLRSVFRNVLNNAVQHNDSDLPEIRVTADLSDDTVTVRIADNGPGIPDAQKQSVFGKGEKALDSPGTGIGLYLVETLVSEFGGEVWIEDNDPSGTIVCLQFQQS